jgi:RNA polymerase sigma factor (sigma-70 family)
MTDNWDDNFDALLAWLSNDRDQAGRKYEEIRHSLINIFSWRGCNDAEDLADETITRVACKINEITPGYVGDPALYFYGFARRLLMEVHRRDQLRAEPETIDTIKDSAVITEQDDLEQEFECLEQCLQELSASDRELVLAYYQQEQPKIDHRKQLARRLQIGPNALRVKVHRIRLALQSCIEKCLQNRSGGETE